MQPVKYKIYKRAIDLSYIISYYGKIYVDKNSSSPVLKLMLPNDTIDKLWHTLDIYTNTDMTTITSATLYTLNEETVNKGTLANPKLERGLFVTNTIPCEVTPPAKRTLLQ